MSEHFELTAKYQPAGDQPRAITTLTAGVKNGLANQTLLGVTGSGKTFTIANVIAQIQKPTLVIAPNKTLAAQLAAEFRHYFPKNAVAYFVSYYDYYQPEAYLPGTDTYIEKDAAINDEIDRLRHAATAAILTRPDTIIVASVSCIYGLGSPAEYEEQHVLLARNNRLSRADLIERLVKTHYSRSEILKRGTFRAHGSTIEVMPPDRERIVRIELLGDTVDSIREYDPLTRKLLKDHIATTLFPAKHFVVRDTVLEEALRQIEHELTERLEFFMKSGKHLEAERLSQRTRYDLEMIRQVGYTSGIENYSRFLTGRKSGAPPDTLIDFFPKNFLTVIDESHVTVPQIGGMYAGDRNRKLTLIEYGFRLPSALDNRPLTFDEFNQKVSQRIYVSATPGRYELETSHTAAHKLSQSTPRTDASGVAEQIVRPTGLIDPEILVRPAQTQINDVTHEITRVIQRHERVLVTTLTKKQAEQLADYLCERHVQANYLHAEVDTLERLTVLQNLRAGAIDVLVGVNLLREGLDLPEVALVAILDADQEGFLRSTTSLIQTMGRAARNIRGRVILYADRTTDSMQAAIDEAKRRRKIQLAYNVTNKISPRSIEKALLSIIDHELKPEKPLRELRTILAITDLPKQIRAKEKEMATLAEKLKFEDAALLRDEIIELKQLLRNKPDRYDSHK